MKAKKKLTQQHRESISKATKGENNPMYGRHHTEEAKARQAAGRKGLRYVTIDGVKHKVLVLHHTETGCNMNLRNYPYTIIFKKTGSMLNLNTNDRKTVTQAVAHEELKLKIVRAKRGDIIYVSDDLLSKLGFEEKALQNHLDFLSREYSVIFSSNKLHADTYNEYSI